MNTWKKTFMMLTTFAVLLSASVSLPNAAHAESGVKAGGKISFEEKTPPEYTLEEYETLTPQQQDEFFIWFESIEAFEAWMENAAPPMPWESENRNPAEYTWDELNKFTNEQQEAFIASFESVEAFESWMENVCPEEEMVMPWEQGNKTPAECTWSEYENLTFAQKKAFAEWFDDGLDFEAWMESVEAAPADSAVMPWLEGGKTPDAYTWTEFEALTILQQNAFIEWFDSLEFFEVWMNAVNSDAEQVIPWVNDKKQPDAYTMDEFKVLTAYQQCKFFIWFETSEAFDSWLNAIAFEVDEVQIICNDENKVEALEDFEDMIDTEDAKDAGEIRVYTWQEYEQMTSEQRILFFRESVSIDGFCLWVETSKPDNIIDTLMPWDNTKQQPAEYTWEEYEAMPVELQYAFFEWFESAKLFEEWMKTTAGLDVLIAYGVVDPNSGPSVEPLVDEQNSEKTKDAYPCKGRTIKNRVNIQARVKTQSVVVGTVNEQVTETTVVGTMMEEDTPRCLVNVGKTRGAFVVI